MSAKPRVGYCGFTDTANVGDFALFQANQRLFGRLELTGAKERDELVANLFGGGTLFPYSLRYGWYPRRSLNLAIGIGVEDPAFSGRFGALTIFAMHRWRFRRLGVRGYRSQRILASNYLPSEVTGDTALALERPPAGAPADAIGVSLVGESMTRRGHLRDVLPEIERYCRRARAEGLEVVLVPCCKSDLEASAALQQSLGDGVRTIDFWSSPIDESIDRFLAELGRLRFVVAERLHAGVLAAVAGVPFVVLPYKPKCLDFAETLSADSALSLPYDRLTAEALWKRTRDALEGWPALLGPVAAQVRFLRQRLQVFAREIEDEIFDSCSKG